MSEHTGDSVVRLESAQAVIRDHFLGWQCRLRQHAMRHLQGRPSEGMQPDIRLPKAGRVFEEVSVLLIHRHPQTITAELRHMVQKTFDPNQRYKNAVTYFSATHYQDSDKFSDRMTALFGPGSAAAETLLSVGYCQMQFVEKNQRYSVPAEVHQLPKNDPAWDATFWHNSLFNPNLPGDVQILGLTPDWSHAEADPPAY